MERRRRELVDDLVASGFARSPAVIDALRSIPRDRFVPRRSRHAAYEDRPIVLKARGAAVVSTISQPTMIAITLELARLRSGHRILEIGAGTGYQAALLARAVAPAGRVLSLDLEPDLVTTAKRLHGELGIHNAHVLVADGARGWPAGAPYDRIVATAAVDTVPDTWLAQLADGGRLLAPVDPTSQMVVLERVGDTVTERSRTPARFVRLR